MVNNTDWKGGIATSVTNLPDKQIRSVEAYNDKTYTTGITFNYRDGTKDPIHEKNKDTDIKKEAILQDGEIIVGAKVSFKHWESEKWIK